MKVSRALQVHIGRQIKDCADSIAEYAKAHGNSMNIIDPKFNVSNIDYDPNRLNVHIDARSVVTGFVYG